MDDKDNQRLVIPQELEELTKDELENFDDYMEMVVTFGYITMFASAFVFGTSCVFIFLLIESRSDLFKVENTMKRPIPGKTYHIGSWSKIIAIFCFFSVFSNIIVSCYASDQIDNLLPWMAHYRDNESTSLVTVFALEHILLFSIFAIKLYWDRKP